MFVLSRRPEAPQKEGLRQAPSMQSPDREVKHTESEVAALHLQKIEAVSLTGTNRFQQDVYRPPTEREQQN